MSRHSHKKVGDWSRVSASRLRAKDFRKTKKCIRAAYLHWAIQPPPHSNSWPVTLQSSWHSHSISGATYSGCIGSNIPQTHTSTYQLNSRFLRQPLERLDQQLVSNFCTAGWSHSIKLTFLRRQNSAYIFSIDTGSNAAMHTSQPAVFISNAHADWQLSLRVERSSQN